MALIKKGNIKDHEIDKSSITISFLPPTDVDERNGLFFSFLASD